MKHLFPRIFYDSAKLITLCMTFIALEKKSFGQSLPKVSEIYDYNIGDRFHTIEKGYMSKLPLWDYRFSRIEITGKYYSSNNDTLFFIEKINHQDSIYDGFWDTVSNNYFNVIDTVFYTHLDSNVNFDINKNEGYLDSSYKDNKIYNGRKIVYYEFFPTTDNQKGVVS